MYRFLCIIEDKKSGGVWRRKIVFPCPPTIGMEVGSLGKVRRVIVCQGDLDGGGEAEIHFAPNCLARDILESHGWEYVS